MTNSIAFPITTTKTAEVSKMFYVTANLIKTVAHYQIKIEKSLRQLSLIEKSKEGTTIGKKAGKYLQRQNKLADIANELKKRMIAQLTTGEILQATQEQFAQEVDLLNWMHFEVTKSYASFISQNFEARIISLIRPIAA